LKINFTTYNIEKKLYQKSILNFIYDHYYFKDYPRILEQDKWIINIRTLTDFKRNFYEKEIKNLSPNMPHGMTGQHVVECYVSDETNRMYYLQNMMVICHELSHMILKVYYPQVEGTLEHDDFWGKAGDKRNFFSTEIHNRVFDGRTRKFNLIWNKKNYFFYGIDIKDVTNTPKIDNGF
jgi:hypothetical protein